MDRDLVLELAAILGSRTEGQGRNIRLQCPMAPRLHARGVDRSPDWSVLVDPAGPSLTRCWACDTQGTALAVLERALEAVGGAELEAAVAFVREVDASGLSGAFARLNLARRRRDPNRPLQDRRELAAYVARCSKLTSQYVLDRGLAAEDIRRWRIGYDEGPTRIGVSWIRHRVVFPVWDETGELVGTTMRTVLPADVDPPKYRDWPGLPKGDIFYGEHRVDSTLGEVTIVEGILDAVIGSRYLPNCIALLGANTGMSSARVEKLRRWCSRVTLVLDADTAGSAAVEGKTRTWTWQGREYSKREPGLRELLRRHLVVRVATLPAGEDPASLGARVLPYVRGARYL